MPSDVKRLPRLDANEVAAIVWLADIVDRLPGAAAGNARVALATACKRIARTDMRREALAGAVAKSDPDRARLRLAALQAAFSDTAPPAQRRFVIPHPKRTKAPRGRAPDGRYLPTKIGET